MNMYKWIVGLALLPRAAHVAWVGMTIAGVLMWVVLPATCSAIVNQGTTVAIVDAGTLEGQVETLTAKLAPSVLEYGQPPEPEGCFIADLKSTCCPAYCQARNSVKHFDKADRIFEGCASGLCGKDSHPSAIVCRCGKGKP